MNDEFDAGVIDAGDVSDYVPPEYVADGIYKIKVKNLEPKSFSWDDKNTGERKTAYQLKGRCEILEPDVSNTAIMPENPVDAVIEMELPSSPAMKPEYLNGAKGRFIKLREALGEDDPTSHVSNVKEHFAKFAGTVLYAQLRTEEKNDFKATKVVKYILS